MSFGSKTRLIFFINSICESLSSIVKKGALGNADTVFTGNSAPQIEHFLKNFFNRVLCLFPLPSNFLIKHHVNVEVPIARMTKLIIVS